MSYDIERDRVLTEVVAQFCGPSRKKLRAKPHRCIDCKKVTRLVRCEDCSRKRLGV